MNEYKRNQVRCAIEYLEDSMDIVWRLDLSKEYDKLSDVLVSHRKIEERDA